MTPSERKRGPGSSGFTPVSSNEFNDSEFEYGPGFVNKLRTKFINLTLKQQKDPLRPALRRVASLEDILDKDNDGPVINGHHHHETSRRSAPPEDHRRSNENGHRPASGTRISRRELLKARSMETLLAVSPDDDENVLEKKNVVIIESEANAPSSAAHEAGDATLTTDTGGKAPLSNAHTNVVNNTAAISVREGNELPPPDTVKSIKKLYEPNSPRRGPNMKRVSAPPVTSSSSAQQQVKTNYKNTLQRNVNVPKSTPRPKLELGNFRTDGQNQNPSTPSPTGLKPEVPAKSALLLRKTTAAQKPSPVPKPQGLTNANVNGGGGFESKILSKFTASAAQVNEIDTDSSEENYKSDEEEEEVINTVKRVSVKAVENIRAGGTSVQFNFKASETIQGHLPAMNKANRPTPLTVTLDHSNHVCFCSRMQFEYPRITYYWTVPHLGPLISRWDTNKFENC